ncbi:MAG: hypothetical protein QY310_11735 [Candidatus Jettenia sp. CY-1]|nr:hypothetical protein [Candidatus Jettenia sp.]WKZ18097.1 MAG: hypothetical protein QY310_11735 [Candidatus Jettenia sp. CY-1]
MVIEQTPDKKERFKHFTELTTTIIIAIATLSSAWCTYQATLWGGIQMFRLSEVSDLGLKSSEKTAHAGRIRMIDGILFVEYLKANSRNQKSLADFFYRRFRPEAKRATDAWLATRPLENPQAPAHPFMMEEYRLEPEQKAKQLDEESAQKHEEARQANQNSDNYIMLTVLFASVMFFGGISTQFGTLRYRITLIIISGVLLCAALGMLCTNPIAFE